MPQNAKKSAANKPKAEKKAKAPLPSSIVQTVPVSVEIAATLSKLHALFQQLEDETRFAVKRGPATACRAFVVHHRLNEKFDEVSARYSKLFNALKTNKIPEVLSNQGLPNLPLSEGFRIGVTELLYASVKPGMKDKAFDWLRNNKLEDLIQETVSASSLSAAARHMAKEDNIDLPDDLFNAEYVGSTSVTVVNPKG